MGNIVQFRCKGGVLVTYVFGRLGVFYAEVVDFYGTGGGTTVVIIIVAIITLLIRVTDTVSADSVGSDFGRVYQRKQKTKKKNFHF